MSQQEQSARLRFESFELDLRTRELSKDGRPIKLQDQPAKLLALLASRSGQLVTRGEIEKALWGSDEFVEFEHAINTAMRKIREALGDDLEKPRFIETLPRKGYRFIAPVEAVGLARPAPAVAEPNLAARHLRGKISLQSEAPQQGAARGISDMAPEPSSPPPERTSPTEMAFALPHRPSRALFLLTQLGYLAMYSAALFYTESLEQTLGRVLPVPARFGITVVIILAMCGIAVRLYLLSSVGFGHPAAGEKFQRLFPFLFILDTFWAVSPLLLVGKIGLGPALAAVAALVYLPFSQRTLVRSIYPNAINRIPSD